MAETGDSSESPQELSMSTVRVWGRVLAIQEYIKNCPEPVPLMVLFEGQIYTLVMNFQNQLSMTDGLNTLVIDPKRNPFLEAQSLAAVDEYMNAKELERCHQGAGWSDALTEYLDHFHQGPFMQNPRLVQALQSFKLALASNPYTGSGSTENAFRLIYNHHAAVQALLAALKELAKDYDLKVQKRIEGIKKPNISFSTKDPELIRSLILELGEITGCKTTIDRIIRKSRRHQASNSIQFLYSEGYSKQSDENLIDSIFID